MILDSNLLIFAQLLRTILEEAGYRTALVTGCALYMAPELFPSSEPEGNANGLLSKHPDVYFEVSHAVSIVDTIGLIFLFRYIQNYRRNCFPTYPTTSPLTPSTTIIPNETAVSSPSPSRPSAPHKPNDLTSNPTRDYYEITQTRRLRTKRL